jgi:hypothetical protein
MRREAREITIIGEWGRHSLNAKINRSENPKLKTIG